MMMDGGWQPNVVISPNCPRCGSSNTKFCYYNNYSLTQPRFLCKGCRHYWTKGVSLHNVPIGGGCRKNRRAKPFRLSSISNRSKSCHNGTNTSSSTTNSDASHIDLALVYANFLNPQARQQPDSKTMDPSSSNLVSMQELGGEFDPYLDFTNLESNTQQNPNSAVPLGEFENHEQFMYYGGIDSVRLVQNKEMQPNDDGHKIVNQQCGGDDGLPPLPGEEVGSLWSNHNAEQPELVGRSETRDPNSLLFGNWSPFDLTSDDQDFSRT